MSLDFLPLINLTEDLWLIWRSDFWKCNVSVFWNYL